MRRGRRSVALLVAGMLVLTACGEGGSGDRTTRETGPRPGGRIVYGLEAETSGGWCLPEAELAVSGIVVARSIYDTLTVPNAEGDYVPYLAESVEPNSDFTTWTIRIRDGVTFHDGTALTADVVKDNLDAYRGAHPFRRPQLFRVVFADIADVEVVGDATVTVTMRRPWVSFPAYLYYNGRVGMMARAQLDDLETCHENLIGTGPFRFQEWVRNDHLTVVGNDRYWQRDGDRGQLPYLDEVEFRPVPEAGQRLNLLEAGEIAVAQESVGQRLGQLRSMAEAGDIRLDESIECGSVVYLLLNASHPPLDDVAVRRAVAHAIDTDRLNQLRNDNVLSVSNGPFTPGTVGHLENSDFPRFDTGRARQLVTDHEDRAGRSLTVGLASTSDTDTIATTSVIQRMLADAGIDVTLQPADQSTLISDVLRGNYDMALFRGFQGCDPDEHYIWWYSGLPTNLARTTDPELDRLLDEGRSTAAPVARRQIYEDLNRRFAEQVWGVWLWWPVWAVATLPNVHGVFGPSLPDGSSPFTGLASGHPLLGMWTD